MPLVLGVDSSTSSCKVELRDADDGTLVASGRAPHPATFPPRSEQDPAAWLAAFDAACAQAGIGETGRVPNAVSVAGQQHGMVVLDSAGHPVRPAKLWNDTESAPEAAELLAALDGGPGAWAAACGSVPVASFTITKLAWLRCHEPDAWRAMTSVLLPHDWLTFALTGERTTDRGDASGTGYWSPAEGRYRLDLLALVDPDRRWEDALPRVLGPIEVAGRCSRWGSVVGPGTGDNMAAALGLGLRPGDLALSFGTSGTAFAVAREPSADPTGAIAGFADATGAFLPLVCTLNATKVTDAVAGLLGVDHARFDELALAAPAGAGGLVLVPHFDGERTPNRPHATGTLTGLRSDVMPAQLARAAVEGVVANLLEGASALVAAAPGDGRVLLIGGGARGRAYRQVAADLLGRPVVVPEDDELVALGACVQAAATLQQEAPTVVAQRWQLGHGSCVEPTPGIDSAALRRSWREAAGAASR